MITPKFEISQESDFIILKIHTPYIKAQNAEFLIDGNQVRFLLNPYFLRLNLPGEVIEDERSDAKYDLATGYFTVQLYKVNPGEHFQDLDMLSKLLATQKELDKGINHSQVKKPLIEELDFNQLKNDLENETELDPFDWELPQQIIDEDKPILNQTYYGFNNQYSGFFKHIQMTPNEINEIDDPETTSPKDRTNQRLQNENEKFDEDYYMNDFMTQDHEELEQVFNYRPIWDVVLDKLSQIEQIAPQNEPKPSIQLVQEVNESSSNTNLITEIESKEPVSLEESLNQLNISQPKISLESELPELQFDEKEKEIMRNLPKKSFIINDSKSLYLGLVDLVYCYCYNLRTNLGENNVESVWIIGKLSPTISCLENFQTLKSLLISLYRRSLSYPLYRNFKLNELILSDTYKIFKLGKRFILKILLQLKDLFDHHDLYYRYSKLFFDDYGTWLQTDAKSHIIRSLAHQLRHGSQVTKADIDWDLEEWEKLALEVEEEGFVEDADELE